MSATFVRSINARVVMIAWLAAWLAFAMATGVTRFVTADEPTEAPFATVDGLEGTTLAAAGLSVSIRPVMMSVAETVVQIEVTGREDLGHRLAHVSRVTLRDTAGTEHFIQTAYLDGRTLTFTFPGSASVAPGPATLEMARLALTNDPINVAPGEERINYVRSSPLAVDITRTGGPVQRTAIASSAMNSRDQGATVTEIVQDDEVIVVNGHLDGFTTEEIQSLSLGGTRLVFADGSGVTIAGGSHGNGPESRDFTFWFASPTGTPAVTGLDLHIEARIPEILRQDATEEVRARLEALEATGFQQLLISLGQ